MRKANFFILSVVILLIFVCTTALGDSVPLYSTDAIKQYCNVWNAAYEQYNPMLRCGYVLSDDNKNASNICVVYNGDNQEADYKSDLIPQTSHLYFMYDLIEGYYGFCVFSDNMKSDLEKAVIYLDDKVINPVIGSSHEPLDMWSITLYPDDVLSIYNCDQFTVKLTIDGKNEYVEISVDDQLYLYEMVKRLIGAQLYTDTSFNKYRSSEYLPSGISIAEEDTGSKTYSFRDDYEAIDKTAKSVFFVGVYDNKNQLTGTASGFVSFNEHLFITNQHVIDGASKLIIIDDEGEEYILDKVVASDKKHDLAILLFPDGSNYDPIPQDSVSELKRGQPVVTIGSPEGYQNTVAFGNISAFPKEEDYSLIQFTAPISHGSSGGCLLDDNGNVIGVTTAGVTEGENLGFAVPINVLQKLYSTWDKTSVETLGTNNSSEMNSIKIAVGLEPTPVLTPDFVLKVGIDEEYPPFTYCDIDGKHVGFDVEMCIAVCRINGWDCQFIPINWNEKLKMLDKKQIDCIWSGMTVLDEIKKKGYLFSLAYFDNTQVILTKNGNKIYSKKDLEGKKVAVQLGTAGEALLQGDCIGLAKKFSGRAPVVLDDYNNCAIALNTGKVDAVVIDLPVAKALCERYSEFRILDDYLGSEEYAICFRNGDKETCRAVEGAILELVENGTYEKLAEKYGLNKSNLGLLDYTNNDFQSTYPDDEKVHKKQRPSRVKK